MPKLDTGELWEQKLRMEVRQVFPGLTVCKAKKNAMLRDKTNEPTVNKTIPIEWLEENTDEILSYISDYSGKELPSREKGSYSTRINRIQCSCLTERDYESVEDLAKAWGCTESKIVGIAVHEWLRTL
tara:strand:- start:131 stop:514 length:384 start_codon:yes stop_codon:yes gene_type:complete